MMKRCIAALVLAALAWWSVPVVFASPKQPHPLVVQEPDQQSAPKAHDHSCCPGAHSVFDTGLRRSCAGRHALRRPTSLLHKARARQSVILARCNQNCMSGLSRSRRDPSGQ